MAVPTLPSVEEHLLDIAIANGYRQLAARIVYGAVLDVKSNTGPATGNIMPAYDFLTSHWGLFLAAGTVEPDIMLAMAEGWHNDNRRLWAYGLDALGTQLELQDWMEEIAEKQLYIAWAQTKAEAQRHRKMKQKRLTKPGDLL